MLTFNFFLETKKHYIHTYILFKPCSALKRAKITICIVKKIKKKCEFKMIFFFLRFDIYKKVNKWMLSCRTTSEKKICKPK